VGAYDSRPYLHHSLIILCCSDAGELRWSRCFPLLRAVLMVKPRPEKGSSDEGGEDQTYSSSLSGSRSASEISSRVMPSGGACCWSVDSTE